MTVTEARCAVLTCDSGEPGCDYRDGGKHVDLTGYGYHPGLVAEHVRGEYCGPYGWWSDGTVDICPECAEDPSRHDYHKPAVWPLTGCQLCGQAPESHRDAERSAAG